MNLNRTSPSLSPPDIGLLALTALTAASTSPGKVCVHVPEGSVDLGNVDPRILASSNTGSNHLTERDVWQVLHQMEKAAGEYSCDNHQLHGLSVAHHLVQDGIGQAKKGAGMQAGVEALQRSRRLN